MKKKILFIALCSLVVILIIALSTIYFHNAKIQREKEEERKNLIKAYYDIKQTMFKEENETKDNIDIVFIGDSITEGYDLQKYYPGYNTSNRGIGGDTTFTLENRLQVSLFDANPKIVVLLIGGNNLDTMFKNYENILKKIKQNLPESKVLLISLTPMGNQFAKKTPIVIENNKIIKYLSEDYSYTFVDIFTSLYDEQTKQIKEEYTTDGAHLTAEGYEIATSVIRSYLSQLIEE